MILSQAIHECRRWLAYCEAQRERAAELGRLGSDVRNRKVDETEKRRRLAHIDRKPVVYDGANLEQAVIALLAVVAPEVAPKGRKK